MSVTRRDFLSVASATGLTLALGTPNSAQTRPFQKAPPCGEESAVPELLLISRSGSDDATVRSFVSQLLEQGVWFAGSADQQLPRDLPESLEGVKAIVLDAAAASQIYGDAGKRAAIEAFVRRGGILLRLDEPSESDCHDGLGHSLARDLVAQDRANFVISHAALRRFHGGLARAQLNRPDAEIAGAMRRAILENIRRSSGWGEYTLHNWKAAMAFVKVEHDQAMRGALIDAIGRSCQNMPDGYRAEGVSGLFATAWLARERGNSGPMNEATAILQRVVDKRPRSMGVLGMCGFGDDPLGLRSKFAGTSVSDWRDQGTSGGQINWNESLHFHCPPLAALGTNAPSLMEEAMRLVEHFTAHQFDSDDLAFHCTRDGRSVSDKWARGQTHAMYGMLYLLDELEPGDSRQETVLAPVRRLCSGLLRYQDQETGLWRNVVNAPEARLESSASAGIVYAMARGVREGWLDRKTYLPAVQRGWAGLKRMYWRGGLAAQCRGTSVGDRAYYLARPQGWSAVPQLAICQLEVMQCG